MSRPHPLSLALAVLLVIVGVLAPLTASARDVTVFAASSLTDALANVGHAYERASGEDVHFSFASSSTLARQIAEGAPADIYVSADQRWMDYVQKRDRIQTGSRIDLLANQLVLIAPRASRIDHVDLQPGVDLSALLGPGRLAVGNPMHVPAGIYAKQALTALHAWKAVENHLARSANVRAALALVALGASPLGIVYRTDAIASDKVKIVGTFPADSHKPVIYPAALTVHAGKHKAARDFFRFLQSPTASTIFKRHGFKIVHTSM